MNILRALGLGPQRWDGVESSRWFTGAAVAVVAGALLALNRLGGLATQSPRAFTRVLSLTVWGWIGLSLLLWFGVAVAQRASLAPFSRCVIIAGRSYIALVGLALVLFAAAGLFEMLWVGRVAVVLAGAAMVITVVGGLRHVVRLGWVSAATVGTVAYTAWIVTVGRELDQQLGHLY